MNLDGSWSWPPPGLERLHGMLATVARRGLLATLLAGPALLWLTTSRTGGQGPGGLTALVLTLGLLAYLGTIMRAAAALDFARQGHRLGYGSGLLLDVLADRAADTPALVAGAGPYEEVRPRVRETMRRLRRASAIVAAAAGLIPLPLLALGVWLALRGAASLLSVWLLLLAPALILGITALVLRGYATLLGQWDLGAAAWDPSPVTLADRVREWQTAFDAAPAARKTGGLAAVILLATAGIFCFVFVVVTTAGMGALAGWTAEGVRLTGDVDLARLARAETMRPLRVPGDTAISAMAADSAARAYFAAAGDPVNGLWPDPAAPPPPDPGLTWQMLLTTEPPLRARAWTGLPPHPALADLHAFARADSLRSGLPDLSDVEADLAGAVQRPVVDAANALRAGDRSAATGILRDLLSAGFLLMDHGRSLAELQLGSDMVLAGGSLLLRLDVAPAVAQADSAVQRSWRRTAGTTSPAPSDRRGLLRQVRDRNRYPALRWNAARELFLSQSCGSPGALLFGPRVADWEQGARTALVFTPADSAAWLRLTSPLDHDPVPRSWRGRRVLRAARWIGGEHLVRTPCMAALLHGL